MKILTDLVARILFILPLVGFGFGHFMNANAMAGMVPSFIPGGVFWIYLTGAALLAAAISIMIKKKAALATLLLGVMLVIFALSMHLPGMMNASDEAAGMASMAMMLKDLGLAGAAFFMSGKFSDEEAA